MNLKGIMKSLKAKPGQLVSDPYARAFAPQIDEAKKVDVTKLKKGDKLKINMGKGKEDVEVMGNLKAGVSKTAFVTLKRKAGAPYTITLSKLEKVLTEAEGSKDHEVSMAQGSLEAILKHTTELLMKIGNEEKEIPAWIQDHIAKAESYIGQANDQYHEYGDSQPISEGMSPQEFNDFIMMLPALAPMLGVHLYQAIKSKVKDVAQKKGLKLTEAQKYSLGSAYLGNGLTYYNREEEDENGDFKKVAHIEKNGKITFFDKGLPNDIKKFLTMQADMMKRGVRPEAL